MGGISLIAPSLQNCFAGGCGCYLRPGGAEGMRLKTLTVLLIGGSLCLVPLLWFQHALDHRSRSHWTREAERATSRLCRALQATDLVLARRPPAATPDSAEHFLKLVAPDGLERIAFLPAGTVGAPAVASSLPGRSLAEVRRCRPSPDLATTSLLRGSADAVGVLYLGAPVPDGPAGAVGWIRLDGAPLLGRPEEGLRLVALAPWPAAGPPQRPPGARVWRVVHGPHSLLLVLGQGADPGERLERGLAWALGGLGLLFTALLAFTAEQQWRRRQRLLRSLRNDPSSGLLSRYALERDLESSPTQATADPAPALLLTLDFPVLDRQRLFLDEADRLLILNTAAATLRHSRPGGAAAGRELAVYRANDHRIAAILPPSAIPASGEQPCVEAQLAELLQAVSAAIEGLGTLHLNWDDIRVTGQWFALHGPRSPLLTLQAFGDLMAGAEPRVVRLLEPADEWQARDDAELRRQLIDLTAQDIDLRFQPILLLADPGCFALELLLRFRSPLLRRLGTGAVLQAAGAMGIAHRIDDLVVDQLPGVQERLRASPMLRERISYVSFNVSADSLAREDRLSRLVERLQQHAVDVSLFRIEITETAAGDAHPGAVSMAAASERLMRELNLRVLIDDFGSGLSNYRRISEAWYDAIKLDIELIRGIGQSFRLQRYVGSFIAAVHGLGKTIVAEGIERYADLVVAVRQGADALQGFHIAPPLPWQELEGFLTGSEWASGRKIQRLIERIAASDRMLDASGLQGPAPDPSRVPLERYILDNWSGLRNFEEFVLLFVNELRSWGLEVHRLSLAFLPDQDDIDCSQYIWLSRSPAEVQPLRMPREFLKREEHLSSPLHHIAEHGRLFHYRFDDDGDRGFPFLATLRAQGCTDYLGLRLESRGVSIPVLTIALRGGSGFQDPQIHRIEAMSSLLSLLFYAFESERARSSP
jgi:EAL domain-containing protein (putative c-di-GMP-specific phosphodiesterase class I)